MLFYFIVSIESMLIFCELISNQETQIMIINQIFLIQRSIFSVKLQFRWR